MTSPTRGSRSKTRWLRLPSPVTAAARRGRGPARYSGAGARDCDGPCLPLGGARQVRKPAEPPSPRMLASSASRIFLASRSLRPFHQTASRWHSPPVWAANDSSSCSSLLAAARRCKSRRPGRSRVPSLVARLELDPLFFAGGTRRTAGQHLGDPGTWRRATARRQQRGRCRRQPDGWTACALPAGESRHPAGDRANGWFQVRRGRRVRARHVLLVSALVAGRQVDRVSAGRHRQVRRVRGARSWRRTAPVDA